MLTYLLPVAPSPFLFPPLASAPHHDGTWLSHGHKFPSGAAAGQVEHPDGAEAGAALAQRCASELGGSLLCRHPRGAQPLQAQGGYVWSKKQRQHDGVMMHHDANVLQPQDCSRTQEADAWLLEDERVVVAPAPPSRCTRSGRAT